MSGAIDQDYIKQQLSLITFNIGESAESVNIAAAVKDIITMNGSPYNVDLSIDDSSWSDIITPSGLDEYFTIIADNITITVVS